MFEDYYDNPALQGLLAAAAGGPIMDTPRQAAVMPMTQQAVAPLTDQELADRRAAANTLPPGTAIVGPYAGKKGLSFGADNTFDVGADEEVRLVDAGGNVIVSGSGVEGANRAVAAAQSLSDELGKNANFKIQLGERIINPDGTVGGTRYIDVARAAPSQSGLGFLADTVLPFAASFIPGIGPIAGAALGSAVSSGLQGRSLQDALMRAAIAGGSAYAGGQLFGPATSGATPTPGGNIASVATPAIPTGAFDGILVNATRAVAPSILASTAGNVIGQAALSQAGTPNQNQVIDGVDQVTGEIVATAPRSFLSPEALASIMATFGGGVLSPAQLFPQQPTPTEQPTTTTPEEIVVTAPKSYLPPEALASLLSGIGSNVINGVDQVTGEIVATAPRAVAPPSPIPGFAAAIPAVIPGALSPAQTSSTPPSTKDGVLGTGLTIPQLLSIGGIGADLLQSLLAGGGGGAGTGAPYTSPFGTGAGFAPGRDMRVNPNILDYERYGFGPEAMFFRPEYSGLVSGAAPAQAPQAMTINPMYQPLI